MSDARPHGRHDQPSSTPRRSRRSRMLRLGAAATAVTAVVVAAGIALSGASRPVTSSSAHVGDARARLAQEISAGSTASRRTQAISRSADRVLVAKPVARGRLWTTAPLDVRLKPQERTRTFGTIAAVKQVPVTGTRRHGYAQVLVKGQARWVTAEYLSKKKVEQPGSKGLVDRPCPGTSGVESGLTSGAVRVYRAVCNNFPQITQYGGYAARGEHSSGKAIDVMTSDSGVGDQIAAFLQRNAGALNLYDIIWQQHIWTPVRASEGWRSMSDRGSATANHYDHVHVSVN